MKDILVIMEQTCQKSIKKLCCIYVCYAFLLCLMTYIFGMKNGYEILFLYLPIGIISGIHQRRIKEMIGNGAYDRIRLLPVKRNAYFISELIFVMISWLPIFSILYLIWFLYGTYIQTGYVDVINQFFFLTLSCDVMTIVAPYQLSGLCAFISILCLLSMVVVFNAFTTLAWNYQKWALINGLMGFLLVLFLISMKKQVSGIALCWIFILVDYTLLCLWFGVRRKRT